MKQYSFIEITSFSLTLRFHLDLSFGKIASQSSIKYNGFPSRAIDGNFNFQWNQGSCMHTNKEQDPWWRVDLGKEYIITGKEEGEWFIYIQK